MAGVNGFLLYCSHVDTNKIFSIQWYPVNMELSKTEIDSIKAYLNKQYGDPANDEFPLVYNKDGIECWFDVNDDPDKLTTYYDTKAVIEWYPAE